MERILSKIAIVSYLCVGIQVQAFDDWSRLEGAVDSILMKYSAAPGESSVPFDRESMNDWGIKAHYVVEGYWGRSVYGYPFPQKHENPWPGKAEFLRKLNAIESSAQKKSIINADGAKIIRYGYRGVSFSRIDGSVVGNGEFCDTQEKIVWPEGYSTHYIEKYNVIPSREFYRYVMSYS